MPRRCYNYAVLDGTVRDRYVYGIPPGMPMAQTNKHGIKGEVKAGRHSGMV